MKINCRQCIYCHEDLGDYFESYYDIYCTHPMMHEFFDARGVTDHEYFPFFPAPGCFELNPDIAPVSFFAIPLEVAWRNDLPIMVHYNSFKGWSGDLIDLADM